MSVRGVHPIGGRGAMLHRNLRREEDKNPGSTDKYTTFGQLIIRKIIKVITTKCHIFKLKCTKFDSWRLSVCILGGTLFMLLMEPSSHLQRSQYKPLNKQHSFLCIRLLNRMSQCRRPKDDNRKFGEILKTVHNWRPKKNHIPNNTNRQSTSTQSWTWMEWIHTWIRLDFQGTLWTGVRIWVGWQWPRF